MPAFSPRPIAAFLLLVCVPAFASAQVQKQRGATMGGLIGAVAGGLIGDHNNEAGAGAAIGGVVGAVTGGLLGDAADKEAAYHQQQYYQQQQYAGAVQSMPVQPMAQQPVQQAAVTLADIVSMTRSGLSEQVIINQINHRGVAHDLQVADIISLHQQGVNELVITAMQNASRHPPRISQAQVIHQPVPAPTPVIVEEHYLVPHYPPPRYRYHRPPVRHHHGLHIRF